MDRIGNLHNARSQRKWMTLVTARLQEVSVGIDAVGDGAANDTGAIQAAEDAANSSYLATGAPTELVFPAGIYAITDTIVKKAGVHWRGPGRIRRRDNSTPTGSQWALVTADGQDNWSIDGLSFEAISHQLVHDLVLPFQGADSGFGNKNTCIDVQNCINWTIRNCTFRKFSQGIKHALCDNFNILFNDFDSEDGTDYLDMIDGTWDDPYASTAIGTGAICVGKALPLDQVDSTLGFYRRFTVVGNTITVPGLDIAIEVCAGYYYDATPEGKAIRPGCVVALNTVRGCTCGIQVYHNGEDEGAPGTSYAHAVLLSENHISYTWEQGIYIRSSIGVTVQGGTLHYVSQKGTNGSGSSAGAVMCRVSPFDRSDAFPSARDGRARSDWGVKISDVQIFNHGRPGILCDPTIQCDPPNVEVSNCTLVRSREVFARSPCVIGTGSAVLTGVSDIAGFAVGQLVRISGQSTSFTILSLDATARTITLSATPGTAVDVGGWITNSIGIGITGALSKHVGNRISGYETAMFSGYAQGNKIEECHIGTQTTATSVGKVISNNVFERVFYIGMVVADAPAMKISGNRYEENYIGIRLGAGCLSSDIPARLTDGAITNVNDRGGSIDFQGNQFVRCQTPRAVTGTTGTDGTFRGRCATFLGNTDDGRLIPHHEFAAMTVPVNHTASFAIGDKVYPTVPTSPAAMEKFCVMPGTHAGSTATATGDLTSGSPWVRNLSAYDGFGPGIYVNFTAGVAGTVRIIDLDLVMDIRWGDGVTTVFSDLSYTPGSTAKVAASVAGSATTISAVGTTSVTFSTAPGNRDKIVIVYFAQSGIKLDTNATATAAGATISKASPEFAVASANSANVSTLATPSVGAIANTVTTASFSPVVGTTYYTAGGGKNSTTAIAATPVITDSLGDTWILVGEFNNDPGSGIRVRGSVYRWTAAATTAKTVTVTNTGATTVVLGVLGIAGAAAGAPVQSAQTTHLTGDPQLDFALPVHPFSTLLGFWIGYNGTNAVTQPSGWTELSDDALGSSFKIETCYIAGGAGQTALFASANTLCGALGVEVRPSYVS